MGIGNGFMNAMLGLLFILGCIWSFDNTDSDIRGLYAIMILGGFLVIYGIILMMLPLNKPKKKNER